MFARIKSAVQKVKTSNSHFAAPAAGAMAAALVSLTPTFAASVQDPMTLQSIISTITEILTAVLGWVTQTVTMVTNNPLMLIFVVIPLIFLGVNMLRRLLNI